MTDREEQLGRIEGIVTVARDSGMSTRALAAHLLDQGLRVRLPGDGPLVAEAVAAWEKKKAEARAAVLPTDSSEGNTVVNPDALYLALCDAGKPLTRNGVLRRVTGLASPSGRRFTQWKAAFQELIDSGRVVRADPDAGYVYWKPASDQGEQA